MILEVKINGISMGKIFLLDDVHVPDISQIPIQEEYSGYIDYAIAKADHFNYSLMSKTDVTDFLYRASADTVRGIAGGLETVLEFLF